MFIHVPVNDCRLYNVAFSRHVAAHTRTHRSAMIFTRVLMSIDTGEASCHVSRNSPQSVRSTACEKGGIMKCVSTLLASVPVLAYGCVVFAQTAPANTANGTMPNNQPRAIKTFTVRGDQPDASGAPATSASQQPPAAKPAAAARASRTPAAAAANANASASSASAPLSLSPQAGAQPAPGPVAPTRVATNAPVPIAPAATSSGGGYLVQVSSQKNEADAESSYRVLQGKYPSVLGSQSVLVKRVDLGEKGIYYRAFAGPFSSVDQATQVCSSLKAAGGPQCIIQRN